MQSWSPPLKRISKKWDRHRGWEQGQFMATDFVPEEAESLHLRKEMSKGHLIKVHKSVRDLEQGVAK